MNLSSGGDTLYPKRPGVANCFARFDEFYPNMPFEDFVAAIVSIPDDRADPHFRSQSNFFSGRTVDFIGYVENINSEWRVICDKIGLSTKS